MKYNAHVHCVFRMNGGLIVGGHCSEPENRVTTIDYKKTNVREVEDGKIEFEVLPEHVKLLRNSLIDWNDEGYGSAQINPKRPYGSIHLFNDMERILETKDILVHNLGVLHSETPIVLQIALTTGKFKPGVFRADKFQQNWKEYKPNAKRTKKTFDIDSGQHSNE